MISKVLSDRSKVGSWICRICIQKVVVLPDLYKLSAPHTHTFCYGVPGIKLWTQLQIEIKLSDSVANEIAQRFANPARASWWIT